MQKPTGDPPNPDDAHLFADHWIIIRKDGTPVLNGSPQDFETSLRTLLWKNRSRPTAVDPNEVHIPPTRLPPSR
jgi:hypothetical protein